MNPISVAARGKGTATLARRARVIGTRYGLGPGRMERRLAAVQDLADRYDCRATLPVTAAAVERHPRVIARYAALGIEFAVHGYYHVDHIGLSTVTQVEQLGRARRTLEGNGIPAVGFRAPYLRSNEATLHALREHGFLYDSSQAVHWPIDPALETDGYRRVLDFYDSLSAAEHPALPRIDDGLVRIPCCLPDDESVVDRLGLTSEEIAELWLGIQRETHERGELFTMQVHPERVDPCAPGIEAVLAAARAARPAVWIARLEEIARWWSDRAAATVSIGDADAGRIRVDVDGPAGLTFLARNLDVPGAEPWADGYRLIHASGFTVPAEPRPFIGVHPDSPQALSSFLREQGYIVELAGSSRDHTVFLRREGFSRADERPLLAELESGGSPLVRLGRWPDGARSTLALTGDVDALTIWDFALRFLGR